MSSRYDTELDKLADVYSAAKVADIQNLARVVETGAQAPLLAVGSGGSFSTARFAALIHEHFTGQVSRAVTPLEFIDQPKISSSVACFSASGRNRDIGMAFKTAAMREAQPCWGLVLSDETAMHSLSKKYRYSEVIGFSDPSFKDGFLAVASLLASAVLLTRAYELASGSKSCLPTSFKLLEKKTTPSIYSKQSIADLTAVAARQSISVIHSPNLVPAAVDLESRFVEAALGALHIADFRNFGHGRHHWMAKRPEQTGVLALVSENDQALADRTLGLLPSDIPIARLEFNGDRILQSLSSLVAALVFASYGGKAASIDPGKPGVPLFGRKLYNLGPGPMRRSQAEFNRDAAVTRKSQNDPVAYDMWAKRWKSAIERLQAASIGAVVMDYDGTLCDARDRYHPLPNDMKNALVQVLSLGLKLGIATGRGPSAGQELRKLLPKNTWSDVVIGYYNGSIITTLANEQDPIATTWSSGVLLKALSASPDLKGLEMRDRGVQLSLTLRTGQSASEAVEMARIILKKHQIQADIVASSHSIDIVLSGASKINVVNKMKEIVGDPEKHVLRIGDKGAWPGNDAELLNDPFGLSVEEVSGSPDCSWNLTPAGSIGPQGTLYYLNALTRTRSGIKLKFKPGDRGVIYEA